MSVKRYTLFRLVLDDFLDTIVLKYLSRNLAISSLVYPFIIFAKLMLTVNFTYDAIRAPYTYINECYVKEQFLTPPPCNDPSLIIAVLGLASGMLIYNIFQVFNRLSVLFAKREAVIIPYEE